MNKLKSTIIIIVTIVICIELLGCRTNSSGWPVIWGLNNGQTYSQPKYLKSEQVNTNSISEP